MGAYENPETAIDTQSGQHWRNLQQTITAAGQNVTNTIIASQKEKEEEKKEAKKEKAKKDDKEIETKKAMVLSDFTKYNSDVSSLKVTNPGVDFVGLNTVANNFAALNQEANDPTVDSFALKKKLVGLDGTVDQVKTFIGYSATGADQYGKAIQRGMKQQGGIASANDETTLAQANNIFSKTPNYAVDYNEDNSSPNMVIKFNKNSSLLSDGNPPKDINLTQLSTILKNDGDLVRYVPDVEKIVTNSFNGPMFNKILGMQKDDKGTMTWDGQVTDPEYVSVQPNKETTQAKGANNAIMEVTTYKTVINREKLKTNPAFISQVDAVSAGILNESKYGATDLYRDVLIPAWNASHPKDQRTVPNDATEIVKPEQFKELFAQFYVNHIQDYPAMENGKLKQTMKVITSGTGGSGGGVSAGQAKVWNGKIQAVITQKNGIIPGTNNRRVVVKDGKGELQKWNSQGGVWDKMDSSDDIFTLAEQAGTYSVKPSPPRRKK